MDLLYSAITCFFVAFIFLLFYYFLFRSQRKRCLNTPVIIYTEDGSFLYSSLSQAFLDNEYGSFDFAFLQSSDSFLKRYHIKLFKFHK